MYTFSKNIPDEKILIFEKQGGKLALIPLIVMLKSSFNLSFSQFKRGGAALFPTDGKTAAPPQIEG